MINAFFKFPELFETLLRDVSKHSFENYGNLDKRLAFIIHSGLGFDNNAPPGRYYYAFSKERRRNIF